MCVCECGCSHTWKCVCVRWCCIPMCVWSIAAAVKYMVKLPKDWVVNRESENAHHQYMRGTGTRARVCRTKRNQNYMKTVCPSTLEIAHSRRFNVPCRLLLPRLPGVSARVCVCVWSEVRHGYGFCLMRRDVIPIFSVMFLIRFNRLNRKLPIIAIFILHLIFTIENQLIYKACEISYCHGVFFSVPSFVSTHFVYRQFGFLGFLILDFVATLVVYVLM